MKKLFFILAIVFFFFTFNTAMAQCPMCKTAVESSIKSGQNNVGKGLNDGILYLLAAPYLFVGALGVIWFKKYRAKQMNASDENLTAN
jgi:hypothetical protein